MLLQWHFSSVPRVLTTAHHKSKSSEGDFLLSSLIITLNTTAAAEGPSPGEGRAGIIPQVMRQGQRPEGREGQH